MANFVLGMDDLRDACRGILVIMLYLKQYAEDYLSDSEKTVWCGKWKRSRTPKNVENTELPTITDKDDTLSQ